MAKEGPPLYEFVHRSSKTSKQGMQLPAWMRKGEGEAEAEGEAGHEPAPEPVGSVGLDAPEPAPPMRTISVPATGYEDAHSVTRADRLRLNVSAARAWLQQMVAFRLPRSTLVLLGAGAVVAVLIVFAVGHKLGRSSVAAERMDYDRALSPLHDLMEGPPKPLIPRSVAGVDDRVTVDPGIRPRPGGSAVPPPPPDAVAAGDASDPREPGLNYFRLIELPAGADEAGRMLAFLRSNGVDAAAIPVQNGRSVKIIALRGFMRPLSDPEAARYREQLKHLGRKWKAEQNGSSDWQDMIPEKYRPGRT